MNGNDNMQIITANVESIRQQLRFAFEHINPELINDLNTFEENLLTQIRILESKIEKEIKEKTDLSNLIDTAPIGIVCTDNKFNIIFSNKISNEILNISADDENIFLQSKMLDVFDKDSDKTVSEFFMLYSPVNSIELRSWTNKWYQITKTVNNDSSMFFTIIDITDERRVKEIRNNIEKDKIFLDAKTRNHEYLTITVHELRTQVHAINSFTSIILKKLKDTDTGVENLLSNILSGSDRLIKIAHSITNLTELEARHVYFEPKQHNIIRLIQRCKDQLASIIKEKKITIDFKFTQLVLNVDVDESLINKAIVNLMINAISLADKDIVIDAKIQTVDGLKKLLLSVSNDGQTMSAYDKQTFSNFLKFANTTYDAKHLDLGLAMCKEIIELHQGEVWVEKTCKHFDKGTTISFMLPLAQH